MELTRRSRGVAALATFTAVYAVVLGRPLALAGTVLIGAWVVARQRAFLAELGRARDDLTVSQGPHRTSARTGETVPVYLSAAMAGGVADEESDSPTDAGDGGSGSGGGRPDIDAGTDVEYAITAGLPTATAANDSLSITLAPGRSRASASAAVEWPVAGRHRFEPARVTVADGWFAETIPAGETPAVTVEPRGPRSVHVGEGGDRLAASIGEHESGQLGSGLEPAEIREYTAGDDVKRIDWKATARLSTPHVREFESETDRRTGIVVDARRSLAVGPPDETALEYLKQVALAIVGSARRLEDPIGLVTVGDAGIRTRIPTNTAGDTAVRIRRALLDLDAIADGPAPGGRRDPRRGARSGPRADVAVATGGTSDGATERAGDGGPEGTGGSATGRTSGDIAGETTTAADAQAARTALDGDDAFAATLRPFYADRAAYVERVESDPLFAAVEELLTREPGQPWTVVLTDDTARAELHETVSNARARGSEVLVAIAPRVLYEPDGLADVERAYDRYVDFEAFRRRLGRQPGVTALEVGPADRLATVLEAGRGGDRP